MRGRKSSSPARADTANKTTKRSDSSSSLSRASMHVPKNDSPLTRSRSRGGLDRVGFGRGGLGRGGLGRGGLGRGGLGRGGHDRVGHDRVGLGRGGLGRGNLGRGGHDLGVRADAENLESHTNSTIFVDSESSDGPEVEVVQMPAMSMAAILQAADAMDKSLASSPPSPSSPSTSSSTTIIASPTREKPKRQSMRKATKLPLIKSKLIKATKSAGNAAPASIGLKHPVELAMPRTSFIGPVIRISGPPTSVPLRDRALRPSGSVDLLQYAIVNKQQKQVAACGTPDSSNRIEIASPAPIRDKNRATNLYNHMVEIQKKPKSKWICALCQRCAMADMMGDLYGPYDAELSPIAQVTPRAIVSAPTRGRTRSANSRLPAVAQLPSLPKPERVEVWLHEDCVVWSNAIYVGGRLENIDEVIADARRLVCSHCKAPGATLSCKGPNCAMKTLHYPCARNLGYYFDEPVHQLYCKVHINEYMQQRLAADPAGLSQQPWPQQYLKLR